MPLRLAVYAFLIALFVILFRNIKRRNSENFSEIIRSCLPFGLIAFVVLGLADLEARQEIAQNYREYNRLKNQIGLQDISPQMLDGLENVPPNSTISEGYGDFRLQAPQGQYFSWGPFKLSSLELRKKDIFINSEDLIEGFPATVDINGVVCRTDSFIDLVAQENYTQGRDFKQFRAVNCVPGELKLRLEDKQMPDFKRARAFFYWSVEKYLEHRSYLLPFKGYLPANQPFITTSDAFALFTETPLRKLRLDLKVGEVIADINGNIQLIQGELYTCRTEECSLEIAPTSPPNYTFGECEYPQGVTAYLVNFKEGMADWHFKIDDRAKRYGERKDLRPLTPQCEMQRLSYVIKTLM